MCKLALSGAYKLDQFKSILGLISVSAILSLAFYAGIFLVGLANQKNALALAKDSPLPLLYDYDDSKQSSTKMNEDGRAEIFPLSSGSYSYSGSRGISVQQNVTQQNVCSSNTAYCYNEVDNDFNVNPP